MNGDDDKERFLEKSKASKFNSVKGILFMMIASLLCSGLALAQKTLLHNSKISPFEMAYGYGWALFLIVYTNMRFLKIDPFEIPVKIRKTLILRGIVGVLANTCFNLAMTLIPMSKASVLFWTSPMVVAFLGRCFLNEKLSYFDYSACFMAFLGILLIQNPF